MTQSRDALHALWLLHRHFGGWISMLSDCLDLDREDEDYLNDTEDFFTRTVQEWRKSRREQVRCVFLELTRQVAPGWARERRKRYLKDQIENLDAEISSPGDGRGWQDGPAHTRSPALPGSCLKDLRKRRALLSRELRAIAAKTDGSGLDLWRIDAARAYPLENLVETKRGWMLCPLHEDHRPSMLVKNGFGYCFSCGGHLDSIGYLMRVRGFSFGRAVDALQSGTALGIERFRSHIPQAPTYAPTYTRRDWTRHFK